MASGITTTLWCARRPVRSVGRGLGRCSTQQRRQSTAARKVIFSGIQPTGVPHLGNYLGALKHWVRLQNEESPKGAKLFFSVVDLHAITVPQAASRLRQWKREALASLLAVGLDPQRSTIFFQSSVGWDSFRLEDADD